MVLETFVNCFFYQSSCWQPGFDDENNTVSKLCACQLHSLSETFHHVDAFFVPRRVQITDARAQACVVQVSRCDFLGVLVDPIVDSVQCFDEFVIHLDVQQLKLRMSGRPLSDLGKDFLSKVLVDQSSAA
eukprot:Lithocolla_globosa_v1_NODE_2189_length_2118_cov_96.889481.p3 type:complete len:130 gc:universal NODE_2189_length_2118_cov_96.889481:623-1012(+)